MSQKRIIKCPKCQFLNQLKPLEEIGSISCVECSDCRHNFYVENLTLSYLDMDAPQPGRENGTHEFTWPKAEKDLEKQ